MLPPVGCTAASILADAARRAANRIVVLPGDPRLARESAAEIIELTVTVGGEQQPAFIVGQDDPEDPGLYIP